MLLVLLAFRRQSLDDFVYFLAVSYRQVRLLAEYNFLWLVYHLSNFEACAGPGGIEMALQYCVSSRHAGDDPGNIAICGRIAPGMLPCPCHNDFFHTPFIATMVPFAGVQITVICAINIMSEFRCSFVVTVLLAMLWLGFCAVPLTFITFLAEMVCWIK